MSALHHRGSWLVYFNGIEVPAISASVSFGVWGIPQAQIAVPADKIMQRIGADDRVRCTIFALDTYRSRNTREPDQFRLMFDGEILNYGYNAQSQGRSMNFVAIDFIEALTRLFPFFVTSLNNIARNAASVDRADVTGAVNPFAPTNSLFNSGVSGDTRIERPFDFVKNILDYLLGSVFTDTEKSVIVQQWFAPWNFRTKFSSRFVPSPFIEDSLKTLGQGPLRGGTGGVFPLFKSAQSASAVKALAGIGEQIPNGSFYKLIQSIFQHVYYELAFMPTAPYLKVAAETKDITGTGEDAAGVAEEKVIASYMTKPQTLFSIPPACNVLWPSMVTGFSYEENYATQPTRSYLGNPHIFNYLDAPDSSGQASLAARALTVGYPAIANQRMTSKDTSGVDGSNIHNFLTPEEYFKGPVYNQLDTPTWYDFLAKESGEKDTEGRESYNANLQRLYVRYEHFRTRASRRNGGVTMHFNPYVLPGFPGIVIDNETSGNHVFGYFTNVTHSFSQNSMSTSVNFTHAQTLSQYIDTMMDNLFEDGERTVDFDTFVRGAPRQPIYTIRDRTQTLKGMREYYARAFFGQTGDDIDPRVIFDFLEVFGLQKEDGSIERLDLNADLLAHIPSSDPNDEPKKLKLVSDRSTGEAPDFKIRSAYRQMLTDPGAAFSYASRPITTLDQWIEAQGSLGVREGVRSPLNTTEGKGARYYVRILNLEEGPDSQPPQVNTEGNPCTPINSDTIRSWQNRLLKFRRRVYQSLNDFPA